MRLRDSNLQDSLIQVFLTAEGVHCKIDLAQKLRGLMIMEIKGIAKIVHIS